MFLDQIFFQRVYFLEQLYVHSNTEKKVQRFPIHPLSPKVHSLPHYQYPPPGKSLVITSQEHDLLYYNWIIWNSAQTMGIES